MGAAIAERIAAAGGHDLAVWNRSPAATAPFAQRGARVLGSPREAWEHAELCITMLADSAAVEAVATGEHGLLSGPAEGVLMDMSTIDPVASARVAQAAEQQGVAYLRAPVTGNPAVVAAGNLGIIVSGPRDTFDGLRSTLSDIGPKLFYVGGDEQARVVKLAINLMIAGTAELMAEALVLGERYEIDRAALLEVMGGSAIGSPFVKYKTDALIADDYRSTFTTRLLDKDLSLALGAAAARGVPLPLTEATKRLAESCIEAGMGDIDFTAFLPRLRAEAGLD
jgi:3-hydroxyisobutyrate dehydrogenase-like beta-hydroxyacid dehydrogenase